MDIAVVSEVHVLFELTPLSAGFAIVHRSFPTTVKQIPCERPLASDAVRENDQGTDSPAITAKMQTKTKTTPPLNEKGKD